MCIRDRPILLNLINHTLRLIKWLGLYENLITSRPVGKRHLRRVKTSLLIGPDVLKIWGSVRPWSNTDVSVTSFPVLWESVHILPDTNFQSFNTEDGIRRWTETSVVENRIRPRPNSPQTNKNINTTYRLFTVYLVNYIVKSIKYTHTHGFADYCPRTLAASGIFHCTITIAKVELNTILRHKKSDNSC